MLPSGLAIHCVKAMEELRDVEHKGDGQHPSLCARSADAPWPTSAAADATEAQGVTGPDPSEAQLLQTEPPLSSTLLGIASVKTF